MTHRSSADRSYTLTSGRPVTTCAWAGVSRQLRPGPTLSGRSPSARVMGSEWSWMHT